MKISLKSTWLTWLALVAIDVVSRASYLGPRLVTSRGALNYAAAAIALWILVRLLACLRHRLLRVILVATLIALPMAIEWGMFRSFGQFLETTDFVAIKTSPGIVLRAAGAGGDPIGAIVVFVLVTAAAWLLPRDAQPLSAWRGLVAAAVLIAMIGVGASWWRASPSLEHSQPAFCCALAGLMRRASMPARSARRVTLPANPPATEAEAKARPNIVLILGESLAASHLTLYGYDRPTSPKLQALSDQDKLVVFQDAVVMGPHTRTSVPYIMTGLAGPDPKGRVFGAPTIMSYAKSRGYHTAFISAQEESWGDLDSILREGADTFKTGLQFSPEIDILKGGDDLVVLERGVLPTLKTLPEPFLLVVHMDGSHVPYGHHSPSKHKFFQEDGVNSIGAYDNTIRVTDEYVAAVFGALRDRDPKNSWMFFTSDHGQALGEGGAFYHRGYQSNVVRDPLLVFPPNEEERVKWTALKNAQVSACDLAPTLLHLMGTRPSPDAPMDGCVDLQELLSSSSAMPSPPRVRVVSAFTPAFYAEQTMLVLMPNGERALYDIWRGTVTLSDGNPQPMSAFPLPLEVQARITN